jgi:hypothetical protein
VIQVPVGTRIWLVAGLTDMRCGFQGLSAKVQTAIEENPLICDGCEYVAARLLGIRQIASIKCFRVTASSLPPHNI